MTNLTDEQRHQYYRSKVAQLKLQDQNLKLGLNSDYKIVFDLDYLHLMKPVEIKSLASQLSYCYSLNKKLKTPFLYHFSNYKDEVKFEMESMGSKNWLAKFHEEKFYEIEEVMSSGRDIVYLSPDSPEVLKEVDCNSIYVIGGFVDKPVSKYRSLNKAMGLNIKSARLPLDDFLKDLTNPVLNINNVVEILGKFMETGDWEVTLKELIPSRMLK